MSSIQGQEGKFVFIVTNSGVKPYSEVVSGIARSLKYPYLVVDAEHGAIKQASMNFSQIGVITIGEEGFQKAMELFPGAPMVATYLLNGISCSRTVNAACKIISPLPCPEKILSTFKAIFPEKKKVSVVYAREIKENYRKQLENASQSLGISILSREAKDEKEALKAVSQMANESDAFLFIPSSVFIPSNQPLVYEAFFYKKKPVIGFAHKSIRDGALFAATLTNTEIGAKAAEMIQESLEKKSLNAKPHDFICLTPDQVIFNKKMLKVMGVSLSIINEIGGVFQE